MHRGTAYSVHYEKVDITEENIGASPDSQTGPCNMIGQAQGTPSRPTDWSSNGEVLLFPLLLFFHYPNKEKKRRRENPSQTCTDNALMGLHETVVLSEGQMRKMRKRDSKKQ